MLFGTSWTKSVAESSLIDKFLIQLAIPHSVYGFSTYSPPGHINQWLEANNLRGEYVGSQLNGDGYTNGVSNMMSVYIIQGAQETDGLALAIQFPECRLHVRKQS